MIVFKRIKFKNFLKVGNKPVEIDLDQHFLTGVIGLNGSGKSTFEDALCFALYGKAFRKINKPMLINSENKKDCRVELDLDVNGVSYQIIRGIKPNLFQISKEGKKLENLASDRDMQSYLETNVLKMNERTFRQIVILGSKSYIPFMHLSAAQRREVVENLFDIEILSRMSDLVKDRIKQIKDQFRELSEKISSQETLLEVKIEHNRKIEESSRDSTGQIESEIEELQEKIQSEKDRMNEVAESIKELDSQSVEIDGVVEELKNIKPRKYVLESAISEAKNTLSFYHKNDVCPTCGGDIHDKQSKIEELQEKIREYTSDLSKVDSRISVLTDKEQEYLQYKENLNELKLKLQGMIQQVRSYESEMKRLKAHLEREKRKTKDILISEDELNDIRDTIQKLKSKQTKVTEAGKYYSFIQSQLKDSGIKSRIISFYLPLMNKMIQEYLERMGFEIAFQFDSEFQEVIKSRGRETFTYDSFSDGQKMRIDFAILMTFRYIAKLKNSIKTNLLILDEVGDSSLDHNGFRDLMSVLSLDSTQNVFIISHRPDFLSADANRILSFQTNGKFSSMTIEEQ